MGGDHGPAVTVAAAVAFVKRTEDVQIILVGQELIIRSELKKQKCDHHPRLLIINASEVVTMKDSLEVALRRKKDSSMRVAINQIKEDLADVCVSAGNTGALMAISRFVLKTLPNVDRPAICSILPNQKNKPTYVLDLGANVDCEPKHLQQFAIMATALFTAVERVEKPTIGLLNVGEEDTKGNDVVKQAAQLLRDEHTKGIINFYGNVEGNDIFAGTTDIVVCDGFVGNVTLKAAEGLGRFVKTVLATEFKRNIITKLGAFIAYGALKAIGHRLNPSNYNGGSLLGLRGLVIKSHGSADAYSFEWAIQRAYDASKNGVLDHIASAMKELVAQLESSESDKTVNDHGETLNG
jgi:glycerol-3-phosphate acyltransferase PlsX